MKMKILLCLVIAVIIIGFCLFQALSEKEVKDMPTFSNKRINIFSSNCHQLREILMKMSIADFQEAQRLLGQWRPKIYIDFQRKIYLQIANSVILGDYKKACDSGERMLMITEQNRRKLTGRQQNTLFGTADARLLLSLINESKDYNNKNPNKNLSQPLSDAQISDLITPDRLTNGFISDQVTILFLLLKGSSFFQENYASLRGEYKILDRFALSKMNEIASSSVKSMFFRSTTIPAEREEDVCIDILIDGLDIGAKIIESDALEIAAKYVERCEKEIVASSDWIRVGGLDDFFYMKTLLNRIKIVVELRESVPIPLLRLEKARDRFACTLPFEAFNDNPSSSDALELYRFVELVIITDRLIEVYRQIEETKK